MIKGLYFVLFNIFILSNLSCKADKKTQKFSVDKTLIGNDTIKLLSKYLELKLFNNENLESKTRTAYIIQKASYFDNGKKTITFDDYKCKVTLKNDTLDVWLNNNNGYFGNGILIKIFEGNFFIKDIDPKTLKNKIKFINTKPSYQKLSLNKNKFQINDSIYGFIDYKTDIDTLVEKHFRGYFKTLIK